MAPRDSLAFELGLPVSAPVKRDAIASPPPPSGRHGVWVPRRILAGLLLVAADGAALALLLAATLPSTQYVHLSPNVAIGIALFWLADLYTRHLSEPEEIKRIACGLGLLSLLLLGVHPEISAHAAMIAWFSTTIGVTGARMLLRTVPITSAVLRPAVVVIGLGMERDSLAYQLRASHSGSHLILRGAPLRPLAGLGRDGLARWLDRLASRARVPLQELQVLLVPAACETEASRHLSRWLADLDQPHAVGVGDITLPVSNPVLRRGLGADVALLESHTSGSGAISRVLKRAVDLMLTVLALVVLAPLFALISAWLASEGGPVFFRQTRVGRNGRRFTCFKFRTMRTDAEDRLALLLDCNPSARAEWARHQKLADDPRITPLGRLLRSSSLDELPQLFNILRGEMSLVGPRPIIAPEVPGYPADRQYHDSREFEDYARCAPGLTGLWQVSGRHETAHAERIRLDRWYARNQSFWLDVLILLRTIRVVALDDGR